jgi:hypothetical protein
LSWQGAKAEFVLAWPHETSTGQPIVLTSDDVRNIQLGKAALYSGARLLMERMGVDRVDRVMLAGAFGSYIDARHAMALGMIPNCDLEKVTTVGNSAGDGARIALLNKAEREDALHWHRAGAALPGSVCRSDPAAPRRGRIPAPGRGPGTRDRAAPGARRIGCRARAQPAAGGACGDLMKGGERR